MAASPPSLDVFRCCRPCLRRLASHSRSFTTNSVRRKHGNLASFQPTNSPELDTLLNTWRQNVFQPAHLLIVQKNLVYRRKNWSLLRNPDEPATARIGDEVVQLLPVDRTKDQPNTRKSIRKCLQLMRENNQWDNLGPFLMGLRKAKRNLPEDTMSKIARYLIDANKRQQLLLLFTNTEDTGMGLWYPGVVREAMWGAWRVPQKWNRTTIRKGVNFAENIWALMHDYKHERYMNLSTRPTARPEIIAVLMQMHAAKAIATATTHGNEDVEVDAKASEAETDIDKARTRAEVEKYAKLMFRHWDMMDWTVEAGGAYDWHAANQKICMWAPMLHGMKAAAHVLGEGHPVSASLTAKSAEVAAFLDQAVTLVEGHKKDGTDRRGLAFAQQLSEKFPTR